MVNKKSISMLIRFVVSFNLLIILFWIMRNDIGNILTIIGNSNKGFLVFSVLISIPLSVVTAFRLKLLIGAQKIKLNLKDSMYLTFIGHFFNNFLPTAIGGDIMKAFYASKKTNNKPASYAAVLVDRILGFLACVVIAIIGILFIGDDFRNSKISWAIGIIAFIAISGLMFLFNKKFIERFTSSSLKENKIIEKFVKLYAAIGLYRNHKLTMLKSFLLAVLGQGAVVVSIYFFILALGGNIDVVRLFLIIPLVWAISMLPSLNGLGVREGAFVYFLKSDIGADMAFSVSILWLGIIIFYSVVGGILHLVYPVKVDAKAVIIEGG